MTNVTHLECSLTGERYDAGQVHNLSRAGKPLLVRYDLAAAKRTLTRDSLAQRAPGMWKWRELLPHDGEPVSLGEPETPIVVLRKTGGATLLVKDEGRLPTGSFKARGMAVAVSMAKKLGARHLIAPSAGNAGGALAAYAARAGLPCTVLMPEDTPAVNQREAAFHGARVFLVDGLINHCGAIVKEAVQRFGWFDLSTMKEPYRLEGKKTIGLEIAEQLGWRVPDVILCPTGGGVGLIGIRKGLAELQDLGWIGPKLPRLVAVQAAGCAPVVRAFERGEAETEPWADARTAAFGLTVPAPLGGFLVLRGLRETGGTAIAITDEDLLAAQRQAARLEGTWVCPEGAACFAAAARLRAAGWLSEGDEVVVLSTGAGLKYPETVPADLPLLEKGGALPAGG